MDAPRFYRPRFVAAHVLAADAATLGAAPPEVVLDAPRGRLQVVATGDDLGAILEILDFLDAPPPQVLLRLAVVETLCTSRRETGGHALFDRTGGEGPDTVFRGVRHAFEPDSYLRSLLPLQPPFPGVSGRLADDSDGVFDAVLRSLMQHGQAELHACPFLLLTPGVPARLESTVELPETVFAGPDVAITATPVREKAGVLLEALAERVGTDHVVLRIKAWLRQVAASEAEGGPPGYPVLAVRQVDVQLTARDGRPTVVGGMQAFQRASTRRGLPGLARLPALDAVASARRRSTARTELVLVATPWIRTPGRTPPPARPAAHAAGAPVARPVAQSAAPKPPTDS